jgi:tRNA1(Val) A37 N6-methylase TrmN6
MAEVKANRTKKKQLGQFMTPIDTCVEILSDIDFTINDKVLEPSFGCGNFIISIIEKFLTLYEGDIEYKLTKILNDNIWGVELDDEMYNECLLNIKIKWGFVPDKHNLVSSDYLLWENSIEFDWIIGNPPFGGTIEPKYQDILDKKYGTRSGLKIKKETYSFFMIKSIEYLKENGKLIFISSDTFLTIKTMTGLRKFLFNIGFNKIKKVVYFSEETNYPMIILSHSKSDKRNYIELDGINILESNMNLTDNFSWFIQDELASYFKGPSLSKYILGSGGMTIGNNELFLREINQVDNTIVEKYSFEFFNDPITLDNELSRARNNKLSNNKIKEIEELQRLGKTKRNIRITEREEPIVIKLPHPDYKFYNKASNEILYTKPKNVIYWKDNGDACYTFKKNGNWYLGGVGGKLFFEKEALTWQLISSTIKARYLPEGNILDNSSPVIILKDGFDKKELLFILGWLLTSKCNYLLKSVINHTKNIQSKDIERLPYPFWVSDKDKESIIIFVKTNLNEKRKGLSINIDLLDILFTKKES